MLFEDGTEFILLFLIIVYILSSIFISIDGKKRKIGLLRSVFLCFFLTPIIGYFFVSRSKLKHLPQAIFYKCRRCGHKYSHKHNYCPGCESNGRYVKLKAIS